MPVNTKYIAPFETDGFFHVIAKASGNDLLFKSDENRRFFLRKYLSYSIGYFDTYSYVLLDNHMHWLIKCNSQQGLERHLHSIPGQLLKKHQKDFLQQKITFEQALEFQYKDFFISYAMAFNKLSNRRGALFINPFRRMNICNRQQSFYPACHLPSRQCFKTSWSKKFSGL